MRRKGGRESKNNKNKNKNKNNKNKNNKSKNNNKNNKSKNNNKNNKNNKNNNNNNNNNNKPPPPPPPPSPPPPPPHHHHHHHIITTTSSSPPHHHHHHQPQNTNMEIATPTVLTNPRKVIISMTQQCTHAIPYPLLLFHLSPHQLLTHLNTPPQTIHTHTHTQNPKAPKGTCKRNTLSHTESTTHQAPNQSTSRATGGGA